MAILFSHVTLKSEYGIGNSLYAVFLPKQMILAETPFMRNISWE